MTHSEKIKWNYLPGAHTQDVAKRFQNIKRDFRYLRKKLAGSKAQLMFSSTLLVGHWDSGRVKQVDGVNDWLPRLKA